MASYYVEISVMFAGDLEANSKEEAEALAWESWGENGDSPLSYYNVDKITITENDEELEFDDEEMEDN